jgi:fumarate reductase flavoprotein subunit
MSQSLNFDVVTVGGGLAGLSAAARATELGARVAVLERGVDESYPCNSRYAGGIFHVSYHDPSLEPAELVQIMMDATHRVAEPELVDAIATDAARTIDWLRTQGGSFIRGGSKWPAWMVTPARASKTAMVGGYGPDALLGALTARIADRKGRVMRGTSVTSLIMRDGKCCGVVARLDGKDVDIEAAAVVIADGGFQGNAALFREHFGPRPDLVKQRSPGTAVGDGLRMAREAGAAVTALNRFYGHLLSREAFHNDQVWPYPQIDAVAAAAIVVDRQGQRFLDETLGGIHITNELAKLDDPLCATVVLDAAIWESAGRAPQIPPNPRMEEAGGTLYRGDTLAALADAAGIPADALAQTVAAYNAGLAGKSKALPIVQPPFFAIPICAGITNTMGGIAIDSHCRVRREKGGTIDGLYAAGGATGGLEGGGPQVGYVGGLIKAAVLGLRAGEHAAQRAVPKSR